MRFWALEDSDERRTANRIRAERCGGGGGIIRKVSDWAPIEDALEHALELADAYLKHAIADLRERPAIGLELEETF